MVKSEIVNKLHNLHPKLNRMDIKKTVDVLFEQLGEHLSNGERIEIRNFGAFSLKRRQAGTVRNPRDGVTVDKGERYVAYFRAGKRLAERVNDKFISSTKNKLKSA